MRLLIVDDEPIIVNGMVALFQQAAHLDLEVYSANSASEALTWLNKLKIDIVLTDIRMPGLSGLDLQKEIVQQWPRCKIIFLTGHNDFEYVQQAMRYGSIDYLLKTDGFDSIVQAVDKACHELEHEIQLEHIIQKSQQQIQAVLPMMQKNLLSDFLLGCPYRFEELEENFRLFNIPLSLEEPNLLILGRVDFWNKETLEGDRALLLYAVQNIADELLAPLSKSVSFVHDRNKIVWLVQPLDPKNDGANGEQWEKISHFVHGTLETIQETCKTLLKLQISFVVTDEPVVWQGLQKKFSELRLLFAFGWGEGTEILLSEKHWKTEGSPMSEIDRSPLNHADWLETYLESGQREAYFELLANILNIAHIPSLSQELCKMEVYSTLSRMFLSFFNRTGMSLTAEDADLSLLVSMDKLDNWKAIEEFFYSLSNLVFEKRTNGHKNREQTIVANVKRYIDEHLASDLSLINLSDAIGFNPSYLSRLYKQITGKGLSDFIIESRLNKAKELLQQSTVKISEISKAVGFSSEPYFYRFFKKATNMTPQEYRDQFSR